MFVLPLDQVKRLKAEYPVYQLGQERVSYQLQKRRPTFWTTLPMVDQKAAHAIVVSEDWAFYDHLGVDFGQLRIACWEYLFDQKDLRGASTITQQVVKNLFLSKERRFGRKVKELLLAIYMERVLSKQRILEIYLNVIEYGEQIYGIYHASKYYFGKSPLYLTVREGAFLAMLLPNPKLYSKSFKDRELSPYASKVIDEILKKMIYAKYLTPNEWEDSAVQRFDWEQWDS